MLRIINPYPGFENGFYKPYTESEASLFFGRAQEVAAIKLKLRQKRLVTLISDPKAGTSSLLRAGLMPNLRSQSFDGLNGKEWKCIYFQPGSNPILSLAQAIVNPYNKLSDRIKPSMEEEVFQRLLKNDYGLLRVMEEIIGDQNFNILIIIDDLFEAFQKIVDRKIRAKFLNLILKVFHDKTFPVYFLISLKKDNYLRPEVKEDGKFLVALNQGLHKIKFLNKDSLKKAIEMPAKFSQSEIAADLSQELIIELLQDEDQLRKLQLLMSRTWLEWKRKHKTRIVGKEHYYKATGQTSKAISKGLSKSGINIKDLESRSMEQAKTSVADIAQLDYSQLSEGDKSMFRLMVPQLLELEKDHFVSRPMDLKLICKICDLELDELGAFVSKIPTILAMDKRKISVHNTDIFDAWDEVRDWIGSERELRTKFSELADAAILHYIDGIDVQSVISRMQYQEIFEWYDPELLTSAWAQHQHENYELGLDFIAKLQEVYGKITPKAKKAKVKTTMKIQSKKKAETEQSSGPVEGESPEDAEAKKEAMRILGLADDAEDQPESEPAKKSKISIQSSSSIKIKKDKASEIEKPEAEEEEEIDATTAEEMELQETASDIQELEVDPIEVEELEEKASLVEDDEKSVEEEYQEETIEESRPRTKLTLKTPISKSTKEVSAAVDKTDDSSSNLRKKIVIKKK